MQQLSYPCACACAWTGVVLLLGGVYYFIWHYLSQRKKQLPNWLQEKGNVAFIIAHPDDEIMFFFPTIKLLFDKKKKEEIFLLSLSNGDFYGQGKIREKELYHVWSYLGGVKNNCKVMNDPDVQDGSAFWNEKHLVDILADYCTQYNIRNVLTFDSYGVSGHPNHISTHGSVRLLSKRMGIKVLTLHSTHLIVKYLGMFSLPFLLHKKFLTFRFNPVLLLRLMYLYRSQFVYYRILFCLFSQYAYYNTFDLIT
ncbi:N-acetylglucosaminylphosphatidylinositol deacetylase [Plasmodium coatneyi]|uniref:N-acetylglucosaminylphosphatidylinositol deacetylase n=1 Tax=Plasmodium coatneyi TaxID=208452 RepID=A0A1B1E1L7_9APIC|nr:N-acetylglucosaminylphosphatidylinositol deacetylase [Plasmodium coatneyi]ANQ08932.1 N-acetylglucosaminylphosphatidylinositol deacetylase [Plasmodium coatneyi]